MPLESYRVRTLASLRSEMNTWRSCYRLARLDLADANRLRCKHAKSEAMRQLNSTRRYLKSCTAEVAELLQASRQLRAIQP